MGPPRLTKIGKYEVIEIVGRGGMGVVYKAVDPAIGRLVAIKMVTGGFGDDPDLLKRFYREAKSTGSLQHPNIVTVYELGDQEGMPYLVMEFLEGESLEAVIRSSPEMVVAEKLSLLVQVCDGLDYAHRRNVIHRDIKPANIVVTKEGGIKIVDFGIARFGNERFTRTGQVMGSINYMSPEQINGEDTDSRTDIYSTGVVLFEFLTRELPFRGKDTSATLMKILHDPIPQLSVFLRTYPAELDQVLARALAKKRDDRYSSIEDFAFDIQRIQEESRRQVIAGYLGAAEVCVAQSDWNKAKESLKQVLKLDRQHTRANELVRHIQTQLQKQQKKDQLRQLRSRAEEALGQRDWDDALAYLEQAIEIDRTDATLVELRDSVRQSKDLLNDALHRAESANQAGELDVAKKAVEEALAVDPGDSRARALKAIVSKELADRSKRRAVEGLLSEARKELSARRFTAALELLKKAEVIDPGAADVQQMLAFAATSREQEKRKQALEQISGEIEELLNRDEYGAACAKADDALLKFPQDPGLLRLRAFAEKQREAWKKRLYVESQLDVAHRLLDEGEGIRASEILQEALRAYPEDPSLLSLSTIVNEAVARDQNQYAEAERRKLERQNDALAQPAAARDLLEDRQTQEENEREKVKRESQARQSAIEAELDQARELLNSNQATKALSSLEDATRRYGESEALLRQLVAVREKLAQDEAAREKAALAAENRRRQVEAEVEKAQALLDGGRPAEAVDTIEGALQTLGAVNALQSLLVTARESLKRREVEQRRKAEELKRLETFGRERARDLAELETLAAPSQAKTNLSELASRSVRVQDLARRYPSDSELQVAASHALEMLNAAIGSFHSPEPISRIRSGSATKLFPPPGAPGVPELQVRPPERSETQSTPVTVRSARGSPTERHEAKPMARSQSTIWIAVALLLGLAVAVVLIRKVWPTANPVLVIQTLPQGATVRIGDQTCVTPNCRLQLRPGKYELHAQLEGYEPASQWVNLDMGQRESQVSVTLKTRETVAENTVRMDKTLSTSAPSAGNVGFLVIKTSVEGADVLINGKRYDQTTTGGELRVSLQPSEYSVLVEKVGFLPVHPRRAKVTEGQEVTVSFNLEPILKVARLVIQGAPPNASVVIDAKPAGIVGSDGNYAASLVPGEHIIKMLTGGQESSIIRRYFSTGNPIVLKGTEFGPPPSLQTAERTGWEQVRNSHSIEDVSRFLQSYPNGTFRVQAQSKLEDLYWASAQDTDTVAALRNYLNRYPSGRYLQLAQKEIAKLDWQSVESTKDTAALEDFLKRYSSGEYRDKALIRLDDLLWEQVGNGDNAGGLSSYLQRFPSGRHADQAHKDIDQLTRRKTEPPRVDLPEVDDRAAVLGVLSEYQKAYQGEDLAGLRKIWPGMTQQQINATGDFFKSAHSVKLAYNLIGVPEITGNYATVRILQEISYVVGGKSQKPTAAKVTIQMKKVSMQGSHGSWQIGTVRGEATNAER